MDLERKAISRNVEGQYAMGFHGAEFTGLSGGGGS